MTLLELALAVAAASLAIGLAVAYALRAAPTVWLQLAGLALVSVCVPLGAVFATGWVMFHMGTDLKILAVAAGSATAAVGAGLLLARWISGSLREVSAASARLAAGDLGARAPEQGATEIAGLASAFNTMAASVEQLFDARRELVAWASHDLRAPLAAMQAMIEAGEDGLVPAEEYLPTLRDQVRTLTTLVDDLFELARIDAGALTLELQQTAGLGARRLRAAPAPARGGRPQRRPRRPLRRRDDRGDRTREDRARALQPAHQRAPPHPLGRLGRRQRRPARRRRARLGRGHRQRPRARGARPHVRALLARRPCPLERGMGLGLAIARGLVEAHGGRIWAENRAEGGARVSFTLPAAVARREPPRGGGPAAAGGRGHPGARQPPTPLAENSARTGGEQLLRRCTLPRVRGTVVIALLAAMFVLAAGAAAAGRRPSRRR